MIVNQDWRLSTTALIALSTTFGVPPSKYLNNQVEMVSKKLFDPEIKISKVAALVLYKIFEKHSHIIDAMKVELFIQILLKILTLRPEVAEAVISLLLESCRAVPEDPKLIPVFDQAIETLMELPFGSNSEFYDLTVYDAAFCTISVIIEETCYNDQYEKNYQLIHKLLEIIQHRLKSFEPEIKAQLEDGIMNILPVIGPSL